MAHSHRENVSLQSQIGLDSRKNAYLPFSLGPRNCVGRPLALMELRVVILMLLNKFTFKIDENNEDFQDEPGLYLTLNPWSIKMIPALN